jgi:flagellin
MALSVQTNVSSLTAQRNLATSSSRLNTSLERLSTGLKINKSADSASGLVISENQRAQVSGLETSISNIDRAVNFVQTADSALAEVNSLLINLRALAVDSANTGAHASTDLAANQAEVTNLLSTIDDINSRTKFGSLTVFSNATSTFQVGAIAGETESFNVSTVDSTTLNISAINVSTNASGALAAIDTAIGSVATRRGNLGAFQKNTLQAAQSNNRSQLQNLQEAESQIRDTDFTTEIAKFTNEQIRNQAASTVLGLANQNAQGILSLLRG